MVYFKPLSYLVAVAIFMITQSANAVGLENVPNAHFNAHHKLYPEVSTLGALFTEGNEDFWIRYRHEDVNEDRGGTPLAGTNSAELDSIRIQAGFTTARYKGFYGRFELEASNNLNDRSLNIGDDFRVPPPPAVNRLNEGNAIIPDNKFGEVNEAYIGWRSGTGACANSPGFCDGKTSFKVGRQTIIYDNHRWVGDVIWRQNNVSMNAFRFDNSSIKNLGVSYSYVNKVKRLFGASSIFDEWKFDDGHLINLSYTIPQFGRFTAYGYLLDFKDNPRTPFEEGTGVAPPFVGPVSYDSDTFGVRFVGRHEIGDSLDLLTEFEWANQDPSNDADDTPTLDFQDNDYSNIELGLRFGGQRVDNIGFLPVGSPTYQIKVGREVLEGGGDGSNALQTPLATVHAFNGWADKFVGGPGGSATPVGGLEDTSVTFQVLGLFGDIIGKNKIVVAYHDYEADTTFGGTSRISDYGDELNLLWGKPNMFGVKGLLGAIKYADYDADDFDVDTKKWWLLFQYRYK